MYISCLLFELFDASWVASRTFPGSCHRRLMASLWLAAETPVVGISEISHIVKSPDLSLHAFLSSDSHCKTRCCEAPFNKDTPCIRAYLPLTFVLQHVECWLCQASMWVTLSSAGNAEQQRRSADHLNFLPELLLLLLLLPPLLVLLLLASQPSCLCSLPLTVV